MSPEPDRRLLVVAIGSSALRETRGVVRPEEWCHALGRNLPPLVEVVAAGFRLVVTHGSGPQLADAVHRTELARRSVPPLSLDLCEAETQGSLGYAIQQVFENLCRARGLELTVAAVVTRVVVDGGDPAFARPITPIGPLYPPATARRLARAHGWTFGRNGRRGVRRLVPAPRPLRVLEAELVRRLALAGAVPVACGGGGVPVIETPAGYRGVEALVQPELAAATLATDIGAERLVLLTSVDRAAVNYGTPQQLAIERLTLAEARTLLAAGEFPPRTMGPKIEAALRFVEAGGREAVITSLDRIAAAVHGEAGTRIVA